MRYKNNEVPLFAKGFTHYKRAVSYAKKVVDKKIDVCLSVRLECARFLKELELEKDKDYPYYFDKIAGEKNCAFLETLPHVKGKWVRNAVNVLHLEDWQCFICVNVFGWKKKKDKLRRYILAYLELPRKQGKSFFVSGWGLYMFCIDGEAGAEVYCGATSLDQAEHVFKPARIMVEKNKVLKNKYHINVKKEFMELPDGSIFKPIISDAKDGSSPHCAILDEVHQHPNDELFQAQITGMGARDQPLAILTTTAGKDIESFCKQEHDYVLKNQQLDLSVQDLTTFGIIYSIDEDDDPLTVESLKKANPNYNISVSEDYLLRQLDIAKRSPKDRADFLTKHLNVWINAKSAFFDVMAWQEQADRTLNINDFVNDDLFVAVDLASKYDFTVIVLGFLRVIDGKKHLFMFMNTYLPTETIEDSTKINYKLYQRFNNTENPNCENNRLLNGIIGAEVDHDYIYDELEKIVKKFKKLKEIVYDPWHTPSIMTKLTKNYPTLRDKVIEMQQSTKNLNMGMKELQGSLLNKRVHHDGNEILTWNIGNVISKEDNKGNDFPCKANVNQKIDGAVCAIMISNRVAVYTPRQSMAERILHGVGIGTI